MFCARQAIAQRRHQQRKDIETIVEILAKAPVFDRRFQIAMRGRDDAHVAADRAVTANPFEAAFLQHSEQLDLHLQRHVADFVEKQGAAFGEFEAAEARRQGTREGTLLVSEEFALEQFSRDRTAIDRHEGMPATTRQLVNVPGRHLFAGPRLAEYQDIAIKGRDLFDQPVDCAHRR